MKARPIPEEVLKSDRNKPAGQRERESVDISQ